MTHYLDLSAMKAAIKESYTPHIVRRIVGTRRNWAWRTAVVLHDMARLRRRLVGDFRPIFTPIIVRRFQPERGLRAGGRSRELREMIRGKRTPRVVSRNLVAAYADTEAPLHEDEPRVPESKYSVVVTARGSR